MDTSQRSTLYTRPTTRTLYTSYVKIDDTEMSCADAADVTAMYVMMSIAIAPERPSSATAAAGATRPAPCWSVLSGSGYVGNTGFVCSARAERPIVVPNANGTLNQDMPPRMYARVVPCGFDAMARCLWGDVSLDASGGETV